MMTTSNTHKNIPYDSLCLYDIEPTELTNPLEAIPDLLNKALIHNSKCLIVLVFIVPFAAIESRVITARTKSTVHSFYGCHHD